MLAFSHQQASCASAEFVGEDSSIRRVADVDRRVQASWNFADGSRRTK